MKNNLILFAMRAVLAALLCNLILTIWKLIEAKLYGFSQYSESDKYIASVISFLLACVLVRKEDME